jgi:class 3 adenylate cyclase
MASLAVLTFLIAKSSGGALHIEDMVLVVTVGLGLVNLMGASWLVRPVLRSTGTVEPRRQAAIALRRMPPHSGLWVFALIIVFMGGHHLLRHVGDTMPGHHHMSGLFYPLTLIVIYGALMALFYFFSVGALVFAARRRADWIADEGWTPAAKLSRRLTFAILATAIVPLSLSIAHREIVASMPPMHEVDLRMFLTLDLVAAVLIVGASVVFFSQSISRPVEQLLEAMRHIQMGIRGTRARMVTDDEIGAIAKGLSAMASELEKRAFLDDQLGRFVPEAVAAAVRSDHGVIRPKESEATILYSDIEGFTRICQCLAPQDIFEMLNRYFAALSECVRRHGGVITQFQGDAMLVTFNLPIAVRDHAERACRAALEIQQLLAATRFLGDVALPTRVGINTGVVVAGTVGDDVRLGYTVHGDAVNVAQRLEQANKSTGAKILLSGSTAAQIQDIGLVALSPVRVSGWPEPIDVFTIDPNEDTVAPSDASEQP